MTRLLASLCLLAAAALSACSVSAQSPVEPSRKPQRVPEQAKQNVEPRRGDVPASIIESVKADLMKQKGVSASSIHVVGSQAVVWPNGALGCAQPGEMVTQATVPGYRVELEAEGRRFVYHVAERGYFRLCENENGPRRAAPPAGR